MLCQVTIENNGYLLPAKLLAWTSATYITLIDGAQVPIVFNEKCREVVFKEETNELVEVPNGCILCEFNTDEILH